MDREARPLAWLAIVIAGVLALLPLGRLVTAGLTRGGRFDPAAAFASMLTPQALTATFNSLEIGIASTALALILGTAVALMLAVTDVGAKRALALIFVWSLMIAPQVAALAFKTLLGPASPVLGALGAAPPPGTPNPLVGKLGIIVVLGLHHAPLVAITLAPAIAAIPQSLIDAARLDGARSAAILRLIVLPLMRPALVAATLLALLAGIGNFGIPALLGIPAGVLTLPTLIYRQLATFGPSIIADAAAVSMLAAAIACGFAWLAALAVTRMRTEIAGEATMAPFVKLGRVRGAATALLWLVVAVAVLLPFVSLIATALVPAYGVRLSFGTMTLDAFAEVLMRQQVTVRAFANSAFLAGMAAAILALVGLILAYVIERRRRWWTPLLESLIELPYALPGVVLAIACILLFLKPLPVVGLALYATPAIILFAYLARFLPVALKPVRATMAQLARDQEEAAAVDGAGFWQRLRSIVVPTLLPAALASALLVFLLAFNELTVSALLWSAGTETLGVALLSLEEAGLASEAAALGVTTAVIVALLMLLLDRLARRLARGALPWDSLAR